LPLPLLQPLIAQLIPGGGGMLGWLDGIGRLQMRLPPSLSLEFTFVGLVKFMYNTFWIHYVRKRPQHYNWTHWR
jgi:hypothetical protein